MADEITLTIDGRQVTVPKGTLVIEAAKKLGITIPVFCYHTKLAPVGACRQCLVNIEGAPKPQVSCSTQVADGMVVHTDTPEVKEMWSSVVEFLLINHPLDCPVCDRGGECPLQDNTFNYGPPDSRYEHEKRHYEKPVPLSGLVLLDRERCIQCFRCVRFQKEIPDEPQIQMFNRGYGDYIDVFPGKPFDSNFSGNTIELCPVGALLSSVFRFRARPWEIKRTESICPNCGMGCNINVDARNARYVIRYLSRENVEIDDGWLCDQGKFDSSHINSSDRLAAPLVRKNDELVEATWEEALTAAVDGMKRAGSRAGALGSPSRTNEQNYMLQRLMRVVFGSNNIDYTTERRAPGGADAVAAAVTSGLIKGSIRDIISSDIILSIGSDITFDLPVLDLWVQRAVRQFGAKFVMAYPLRAPLSRHASAFVRYTGGKEAELASALSSAIRGQKVADDVVSAASILASGKAVTILLARAALEASEAGTDCLGAVGVLVDALKQRGADVKVLLLTPGANAQGASDVGLLPGYLPGYHKIGEASDLFSEIWGSSPPTQPGLSGHEILQSAGTDVTALWIMGQDPANHLLYGEEARSALGKLDFLVVQDSSLTETARLADVVLPAGTFAETKGTMTSTERRLQRIMPAIRAVGDSRADTEILMLAAFTAGASDSFNFGRIESIYEEIRRVVPMYSGIEWYALASKGKQWEVQP